MIQDKRNPMDRLIARGEATRILVVDDDPAILRLVQRRLEFEGFLVESAKTASRALQVYKVWRPDLVLLDVLLPDDNGFNVCQKMRKVSDHESPILFMSVRHGIRRRRRGQEAGGQGFLPKPFFIDEMVEYIRAHLKVRRSRETTFLINQGMTESVRSPRKSWRHDFPPRKGHERRRE